jgi:hypothetical protein
MLDFVSHDLFHLDPLRPDLALGHILPIQSNRRFFVDDEATIDVAF